MVSRDDKSIELLEHKYRGKKHIQASRFAKAVQAALDATLPVRQICHVVLRPSR